MHGREQERMGFHGIEWYFTGENELLRGRIGENVISREGNGISRVGNCTLRERTGLYGRELDFTLETEISRERTKFHGSPHKKSCIVILNATILKQKRNVLVFQTLRFE